MNKALTRQLAEHIFHIMGIKKIQKNNHSTFLQHIKNDQFLINKKIAFELEDGTVKNNSIWSCSTEIQKEKMQLLLCDVSDDAPNSDFVLIFQFEKMPTHCVSISFDDQLNAGFFCLSDKKWIELDILFQLKLTTGIEQINSVATIWKINEDYDELYQSAIGFLNYQEVLNE